MTGLQRRHRSGTFVIISMELVSEVGSWEAAGVLQRVEWRCSDGGGEWTSKIEDIAAEVCLSVHRTRTALQTLVERGYLTRRRASGYDPTPVWEVVEAAEEDTNPPNGPSSKTSKNVPQESVSTFDGNVAEPPIEKVDNNPLPPAGGIDGLFAAEEPVSNVVDFMAGFDEWWGLYPRKVDKDPARRAWRKAVRSGTSPAVLIAALRQQRAHLAERHAEGFCAYPSTWLNKCRWENTPEPEAPSGRRVVPSTDETYDPAYAATLPPPPRTDLYG